MKVITATPNNVIIELDEKEFFRLTNISLDTYDGYNRTDFRKVIGMKFDLHGLLNSVYNLHQVIEKRDTIIAHLEDQIELIEKSTFPVNTLINLKAEKVEAKK